jgi:hypothetical protein
MTLKGVYFDSPDTDGKFKYSVLNRERTPEEDQDCKEAQVGD